MIWAFEINFGFIRWFNAVFIFVSNCTENAAMTVFSEGNILRFKDRV